jgi:hypothetical protein
MTNFNYWTKLAVFCTTAMQVGFANIFQNEGRGVDVFNNARLEEVETMMQYREAIDQEIYARIQRTTQDGNSRAQEITQKFENAVQATNQLCMDVVRYTMGIPAPRINNTDRHAAR